MLPSEILAFLEQVFWGEEKKWINNYANNFSAPEDSGKELRSGYLSCRGCVPPPVEANGREEQLVDFYPVPPCRQNRKSRVKAIKLNVNLCYRYKSLFGNMTPPEILSWLENYFWNGQKKWINDYVA